MNQIAQLRTSYHLSQQEFAWAIGIGIATIKRYESEKVTHPRSAQLRGQIDKMMRDRYHIIEVLYTNKENVPSDKFGLIEKKIRDALEMDILTPRILNLNSESEFVLDGEGIEDESIIERLIGEKVVADGGRIGCYIGVIEHIEIQHGRYWAEVEVINMTRYPSLDIYSEEVIEEEEDAPIFLPLNKVKLFKGRLESEMNYLESVQTSRSRAINILEKYKLGHQLDNSERIWLLSCYLNENSGFSKENVDKVLSLLQDRQKGNNFVKNTNLNDWRIISSNFIRISSEEYSNGHVIIVNQETNEELLDLCCEPNGDLYIRVNHPIDMKINKDSKVLSLIG